jgi:4-alpha-glucanotransferase
VSVRGLRALTRLFGIEPSYEGMGGTVHHASPEATLAVLRALGAELRSDDPARADVRGALRARRDELAAQPVEPVQVAWDGELRAVRLRLPVTAPTRAELELRLEAGATDAVLTWQQEAVPVAARARGGWTATHLLRMQQDLPLGYHTLHVHAAGVSTATHVIAAPRHAYAPPDVRAWGVFCPLYALHSRRSWGVGDYTDLGAAARWAGELGAGFISTLPLLATFLDAPFEPSPYSPASRLFWNELFVDVTAVPGWAGGTDALQAEIAAVSDGDYVDYRHNAALKRRELERALHALQARDGAATSAALKRFAEARPGLEDYARFRAVGEQRRDGWHAWPARLRDGVIADGDFDAAHRDYHVFAQWQADVQLAALAEAGDGGAARLYLDMPLGVNPDSYDQWRFRELFAEGVSAGAPPDPLFTGGQDWGFRPLNPRALRDSGYRYLVDSFRHHLRHARMLRLDHVMSLYRLFWVPNGMEAREGVYVRYPEEELFAVLTLESARHRAVVIGEDLGTVPPAVRRAMDRHHVHRMHVVQFEASPDSAPVVAPPPEPVIASLNTHDMPTFAGFWRGSEIDDQLELGLIHEAEHAAALARRLQLRVQLSRSLGAGGEIAAGLARQRLLEHLADAPARYLLVNLEDLWLEDRPQNVPGTSSERPNWRRRARRSLDEIMSDAAIARMLQSIGQRRAALRPLRTMSHG